MLCEKWEDILTLLESIRNYLEMVNFDVIYGTDLTIRSGHNNKAKTQQLHVLRYAIISDIAFSRSELGATANGRILKFAWMMR